MRQAIKNVIISIVVIVIVTSLMFVPMWYVHTDRIQQLVLKDFSEYQTKTPDWIGLDPSDHELIKHQVTSALSNINQVVSTGADRNQRAQFKESLYEMIYILVNDPTEENISLALVHIQDDYKTWERSIDKFLNSQLYAMTYTF